MLSIVSAAVAIPYAVVIGLFLASEPSCETSWTVRPATTLAYLGALAVTGGIAAGAAASLHPPRRIGLATIAFNLGLLVVGLVLLAYDFGHAAPFSCLGG